MTDPYVTVSPTATGFLVERYERSMNVVDEEHFTDGPDAFAHAHKWLEEGWPDE